MNYDTCHKQILLVLIRHLMLEEYYLCILLKPRALENTIGDHHV
jgi:hypothetical protein